MFCKTCSIKLVNFFASVYKSIAFLPPSAKSLWNISCPSITSYVLSLVLLGFIYIVFPLIEPSPYANFASKIMFNPDFAATFAMIAYCFAFFCSASKKPSEIYFKKDLSERLIFLKKSDILTTDERAYCLVTPFGYSLAWRPRLFFIKQKSRSGERDKNDFKTQSPASFEAGFFWSW